MSTAFLISIETPMATKCAPISFNYRTPGWQKSFSGACRDGRHRLSGRARIDCFKRSKTGLSEYFSYFSGEALQAKGLLQKRRALLNRSVTQNCVFGVTGKIQNLGRGTRLRQLLNQFAAADAGHDHVSDDQINVAVKAIRHGQPCFSAAPSTWGR